MREEYDRIEAEYGEADELPDEIDERLGEIEQALEAFERRPAIYDPADIAMAGALVSIGADGALSVDRGYVRPDDERAVEPDGADASEPDGDADHANGPAGQRAVITIGGKPAEPEEDEDDGIKPLPERLVIELTAHRTLARRNAVAEHPDVVTLHPVVLKKYEEKLENLRNAIDKGMQEDEGRSAQALRDLVHTVTVYRDPTSDKGVRVEIAGALNALIDLQMSSSGVGSDGSGRPSSSLHMNGVLSGGSGGPLPSIPTPTGYTL